MIDVNAFFEKQLKDWKTISDNYSALKNIQCKTVSFDEFYIKVQYNPERIRSSVANVDKKSIAKRPCFLCDANRPQEQESINYPPCYYLLVNPYPIFPQHLTIPDRKHNPQLIKGRIGDMLSLANDLPDFTILYNGPKCGASAPDHFHFQAGNKGVLPIERDVISYKRKVIINKEHKGTLYRLENYLRECLVFESKDKEWLCASFEDYYEYQHKLQPLEEEPMFNLICWKDNDTWKLVVFPRKQHRPRQYFEEGKSNILLAPGVVDFGGVLVVPREEDFIKLDKDLITDIYSQLTLLYETT
ncbi:hypothetical protein M2138_001616 [Dysgonomonadaceae bacterium PH5-43]|nr:hypothetical protein [Dysgonomonadaceae bacterium PH5-43]